MKLKSSIILFLDACLVFNLIYLVLRRFPLLLGGNVYVDGEAINMAHVISIVHVFLMIIQHVAMLAGANRHIIGSLWVLNHAVVIYGSEGYTTPLRDFPIWVSCGLSWVFALLTVVSCTWDSYLKVCKSVAVIFGLMGAAVEIARF